VVETQGSALCPHALCTAWIPIDELLNQLCNDSWSVREMLCRTIVLAVETRSQKRWHKALMRHILIGCVLYLDILWQLPNVIVCAHMHGARASKDGHILKAAT
jgi:hypothetical protein